ncbi:MAG: short chain dehydrogenase, partial [Solirubrobacterales bacterium]|nr:short chain dehydrogenase [Solirubrobacterales bacterium]
MTDRYQQLINTPIGRIVSKQVGLPAPSRLERYEPGQPLITGPVLLGAAPGGRLAGAAAAVLASVQAEAMTAMEDQLRSAAASAGLHAGIWNPETAAADQSFKALVFDTSGIDSSDRLLEAWSFFHPSIRRVRSSGRVIVLGTQPESCGPPEAIAQRALEGLVRSIGKEL